MSIIHLFKDNLKNDIPFFSVVIGWQARDFKPPLALGNVIDPSSFAPIHWYSQDPTMILRAIFIAHLVQ